MRSALRLSSLASSLLATLVLGALLAISIRPAAGANADREDDDAPLHLSEAEISAAGIQTEAARREQRARRMRFNAAVRANQDRLARVAPRVPGRVVGVDVQLGASVRAGDRLATLDSFEVGEARSNYLQADSLHRLAKADLERTARLRDADVVARKELQRVQSEYERSRVALQSAENRLKLMSVDPGSVERGLSVLPLRAPFDGTVIEKSIVLGDLAQPDRPLFTIADLSTLWVEAIVPEGEVGRVQPGMSVEVRVPSWPDRIFTGHLAYLGSVLDRATRSMTARIEVPDRDGLLKPGMFATVWLAGTEKESAITVPISAQMLLEGSKVVFVRERSGFEPRVVEADDPREGRVRIREGIAEGEQVVVSGAYTLKARLLKSKIGDTD